MSDRFIPNTFSDYNGERLLADNEMLAPQYSKTVMEGLSNLMPQLQAGLQHSKSRRPDFSVYTGQTGIAMLYLHLYHTFPESSESQDYLQASLSYLQPALQSLGSQDVYTFLCGDAGVLAIAAVLHTRLGDADTGRMFAKRLEQMGKAVVKSSGVPDEHLYGRCGYLAAVMFVQSHLGDDSISRDVIGKVVHAILESGQHLSQKKGFKSPLMYAWYKEYYLGAAHGLAGICYTLLLTRKDPGLCAQIDKLVRPTLDHMLTLAFPSGNYPPVLGEGDDRLVHWCHGAPGWASMWALAYQMYTDKRYLEAAERCCEVTWQRGLLKKGYGLCHGAAGNAYAFLALFRLTREEKHLYRAYKFADWCCHYGDRRCRVPDHPLSMYEGMAGTIYFLADILQPLKARFPAYEF